MNVKTVAPFRIYSASAGSGKTFTLVRNYIAGLLQAQDHTAYKNILAITFTNKAAAEMKGRIITSLEAFAQETTPEKHRPLYQAVKGLIGMPATAIKQKSGTILKSILHNYAAFEISTIDSFTHRLLQTFAKDLNIPVNFDVEIETEEILEEAVNRVIAQAGKDKTLTKTLVDFALFKTDEDRSWDIERDLNDIAKLLVNEANFAPLSKLEEKSVQDFTAYADELAHHLQTLKKLCLSEAKAFFDLIAQNGIDPDDFKGNWIPKFFTKIIQGETPYPTGAKWQKNIESDNLYTQKQTEGKKQIMDDLQPQIAALFRKVESALYKIEFYRQIHKNTPSLSLLAAIKREVEVLKEERGLLLISEFNKKISDNIKNQPAPFIYERLGERYFSYFIDEFQDTSALQWENFKPLLAENLTKEHGKLTLVGDAKQSIYRWRGGKAEQFMALCGDTNPFFVKKEVKNLHYNFRSLPEVVNFNNAFFAHSAQHFTHKPYQQLFENAQQIPHKKRGGYVELSFIEAQNSQEEQEVYPVETLNIIKNLTAKNHPYREMCILVRKKKEGVAIADVLSQHNIPIISSETLLLKKSPKVQFLIALLHFSLTPQDNNLKFDILNFLYQQLMPEVSNYDFIQTRLKYHGNNLFNSLQSHGFSFNIKKLQQLPFYNAIEYCISTFKLLQTQDAYVLAFLDFVYDYIQGHSGGINDFLDWWALKEKGLSISVPEGGNAVQILTIHKAKGLEFPIVIYPFANEDMTDMRKDNVWISLDEQPNTIPLAHLSASSKLKDFNKTTKATYDTLLAHKKLDAMNLFYVAMTRAEEQLYVLSKYEVNKKGDENPNKLSGLLINFLKSQGLWKDQQFRYQFGEIPTLTPQEDIDLPSPGIEQAPLVAAPSKEQTINMVTKSGELWGTQKEKAIEEGNIIHRLLKDIILKTDVDKTVNAAVMDGIILNKDAETYTRSLKAIVHHPDLQVYFSDAYTVHTEKEILINHAYKRLDRLCLKGETAIIIDYKTGKKHPDHQKQINAYAAAIQSFGYTVEKKLVVYLHDGLEIHNIE